MAKLYLALGSNQGDRKALLDAARAACDASLGRVTGCSDYIETAPWGFSSPHPFLNAVLELETELSPIDILERTQEIERQLGRQTKSSIAGYQDRPIDLDLLLYDDLVLETPRLTLPHPYAVPPRLGAQHRRALQSAPALSCPHLSHERHHSLRAPHLPPSSPPLSPPP